MNIVNPHKYEKLQNEMSNKYSNLTHFNTMTDIPRLSCALSKFSSNSQENLIPSFTAFRSYDVHPLAHQSKCHESEVYIERLYTSHDL